MRRNTSSRSSLAPHTGAVFGDESGDLALSGCAVRLRQPGVSTSTFGIVAAVVEQTDRLFEVMQRIHGAQGRDRTTDTAIFSRMLYQLSYLGVPRKT
jgi:protein-disulfide isomerase-like protein with CxxC motif